MRKAWVLLVACAVFTGCLQPVGAATAFADPAFQRTWQAAESAVPNFWGPLATATDGFTEAYKESPGGQRLVQYFDKARMELNRPGGPVTTGLLTVELRTGNMQVGDASFEQRQPAKVNIAGDPGSDGPTYADLAKLPGLFSQPRNAVSFNVWKYVGAGEFQEIVFAQNIPNGTAFDTPGRAVYEFVESPDGKSGLFVYARFAEFINLLPLPRSETTGYPITPVIFAQVKVAGRPTWILIQAFERYVLTYNPNNDPDHRVEFGNVGQHYNTWRYGRR